MPQIKRSAAPDSELAEVLDSIQDAIDELDESATGLGVMENTGTDDASVKFGGVLVVDPTQATASTPLRVTLPTVDNTSQGKVATVVNNTSSTNNVVIAASDGNTINGAVSITVATAWQITLCVCTGPTTWVAG